jgi:exodeoxyribonuclease-5
MNRTHSARPSSDDVEDFLRTDFPFKPTTSQDKLIRALGRFLVSDKPNCLLVVKGYAGTGKTTAVRALIEVLPKIGLKYVMMAPTGRAAKVMSAYTGKSAGTIHKKIYFRQRTPSGGSFFVLGANLHTDTVFIVDEASMIGAAEFSPVGSGNLLEDLFEYAFNGKNCRLILIGDAAQLPPVGSRVSPALDLSYLRSLYSLTAAVTELSDVMRQREGSGILEFATSIRNAMGSESTFPLSLPKGSDTIPISGNDLQEALEDEFSGRGVEGTILITRSNKRANQFNFEIRSRVFYRDEELSAGDLVMAVKNNYHWTADEPEVGFIANGESLSIRRLGKVFERYGFRFQEATVSLLDQDETREQEVVLWLDALTTEGASMPEAAVEKLYRNVLESYADLPTKKERREAVKKDPFYNALQVKFAYAVTCHKSQGGQWPVVFVDQGFLTEDMLDTEYLRWLYTAITRASEKVYLINFSDKVLLTDL